jgi:hypothetical protein
MQWTFFLASCLLTAALLVPHAGAGPVGAGLALAALIHWGLRQLSRRHD